MNIQEQEERDFFPQTDLQNAFAQSRMETELVDQEVRKALAAGKYVLAHCGPVHCRITDAVLGEGQAFVSAHDTREEAEAALQEREERLHPDDICFAEFSDRVLSPTGDTVVEVNDVTGDVTEFDANTGEVVPDDPNVPF